MVDIVRVFSVYGLLLPIDRMTGVGLDSINRPKINAIKVLCYSKRYWRFGFIFKSLI
jgi:hypothetical protein